MYFLEIIQKWSRLANQVRDASVQCALKQIECDVHFFAVVWVQSRKECDVVWFDYLFSECVWGNSGAQLDDKDECQKDWKWQRHAMVFLDGSTAAEKSDEENDASDND